MFKIGNEVRFKPNRWNPMEDLPDNSTFTIGAIVSLPNPDDYYVDPYYWNTETWGWARGKTRLEVAGHPRSSFLKMYLGLTQVFQNV